MLFFGTAPESRPLLQRQLDADRESWLRALQLETDAEFDERDKDAFKMHGLFAEIPGADRTSLPIKPQG